MIKKIIYLIAVLIWTGFSTIQSNNNVLLAGDYIHQDYDWAAEPSLHELTEEEKTLPGVIIKDQRIFEYHYGSDNVLYVYETVHKIIRVSDDQAIDMFNKVFVPMSEGMDFEQLKARAISPEGKITLLNKDNIKELDNVQNFGAFKIFAIEGVEKGGELEYFYTTKGPVVNDMYGREFLQSDVKAREVGMKIISPKVLIFKTKSYNGFPELELKETDDARILSATATDVPPLVEETYSYYRANLMKVDFKLTMSTLNGSKRLYDIEDASERFHDIVYGGHDKNDQKAIKKAIKKLKLKRKKEDGDKIIAIENYIKSNITYDQGTSPDYLKVEKILVNKIANKIGMARLHASFFQEADIHHRLVVTNERAQSKFDKDFLSWNNFAEFLYYFPKHKKFLSPDIIAFRYGAAPYTLANNYGLFISPAGKNGKVEYIPLPEAKESINKIDAEIMFDDDFNVTLKMRHGWTGYRAAEFRTLYKFQEMEFIKGRVVSGMEDADVKDIKLTNEKMEDSSTGKEFYVESTLEANSLTEKAGNNVLFKLGEIIGEQVELYQEHERQHPIDMEYPMVYKRVITFDIPDGYYLRGMDDLKINKAVTNNKGEKVCAFVSDYKKKGNTVTVKSSEYYKQISLPKSQYEAFREVINAAADFNKVVLVFEKK